jgi:nitroreductase
MSQLIHKHGIQLPTPTNDGTTSVFTALAQRRTTREISNAPLPIQELANLLWAACGVNRPTGPFGVPGRTAASASNSQEIDLYVALESGVYLYDAINNWLAAIVLQDLRAGTLTPGQRGVNAKAPVQLIFVADLDRLTHAAEFLDPALLEIEVQKSYYYVDTGIIAGNVYLFAAARGLAAWFHGCHRTDLARRLGLRPEQRVLFAQSVGYPDAQKDSRGAQGPFPP